MQVACNITLTQKIAPNADQKEKHEKDHTMATEREREKEQAIYRFVWRLANRFSIL